MPVTRIPLPTDIGHVSVLDAEGNVDESLDPGIPREDLRRLYRTMLLVRAYDDRRLRLQRQGRIGTFAPVKGQEAAQLGSVYALSEGDWMVPAFRETAAALWRGMRLEDDLLYCAGYEEGVTIPEEGRDLPIAIPVASQLPHAVGLAWARKLQGTQETVLAYFGDGATSEGDFHEALNFASVFQVPVVFFCQNNHYAISVPLRRQTHSRTLAQKGVAYDMYGVVVDGNDLLAVYRATQEAVDRARRGEGPSLIEAVTYRLSVHTTADDPTKYRSLEEVREWEARDPVRRLRRYLVDRGMLAEDEEGRWIDEIRGEVQEAVDRFERTQDGSPTTMFDHVYAELPRYVEKQRREFARRARATEEALTETGGERRAALAGQEPTPGGVLAPKGPGQPRPGDEGES